MTEPLPTSSTSHWMAAAHALQIAELVGRWGVRAEDLFRGLDVDPSTLTEPGKRLSLDVVSAIAARAKALTGEPGLGFYLGLSMRVSSHGYVGFAAMAANTLRDALALAERFAPTRSDAIAIRLEERGDEVAVVIDELASLGEAREMILTSFVVGLHEIGAAITGRRIPDRAEIALPEPAHARRFERLIGDRIRWGRPAHRLVFDRSALDWPLVQADPAALRLAREQCERELDALGYGARVVTRVRSALATHAVGARSIEEVSAALAMSPRTLKRRLATEGTTFSAIVDELRRDRAMSMLASPEVSIEAVAEGTGYSDVANFTRAFRRWTGSTPTGWRRASRGGVAVETTRSRAPKP
ncbi:MAG: AraC family transcriptional regulator [Polyangiaceae bacterium]